MSNTIADEETLARLSKKVRGEIVHMTSLAKSGHPGGPLGFVEPFLLALDKLNLDPKNPFDPSKDKLVASAGHYSALIYSGIANLFFPDKAEAVTANFRSLKDVVEGHVTHKFPFIWDSTGHLGYGPSIAAGHAVADRLHGYNSSTILCTMGDGEQTKGVIQEAMRFIRKYALDSVKFLIDNNNQQIMGECADVMEMDFMNNLLANGIDCFDRNAYDFTAMNSAISEMIQHSKFNAVVAHTAMGNGVKESEGTHEYHGKPLTDLEQACKDLGVENKLESYKAIRESDRVTGFKGRPEFEIDVNPGERIVYTEKTACRKAFGNALVSIAKATLNEDGTPKEGCSPMAAFDCDLAGSVGLGDFSKEFPENFFQVGIQENAAAMIAGTASTRGVSTWISMFGAFGHCMTYNEHMLTAMNDGNLKLVTTHNSIDVGEDSKTHSPINYLVLSGHPGWQTFCPADANQADAIVRYMAENKGNMHMAVGRSKLDIITKQDSDEPFFDKDYHFNAEEFEILRDYTPGGSRPDAVIITYGTPAGRAVKAAERLNEEGASALVINVPNPKQIPDGVAEHASLGTLVVTFEDHNDETGISKEVDSALLHFHAREESFPEYQRISIGMDQYSKSGPSEELYRHFGIHEDELVDRITQVFGFE